MQQKVCQEWEDKVVVLSGKKVKWKQAMLKMQKSIALANALAAVATQMTTMTLCQ